MFLENYSVQFEIDFFCGGEGGVSEGGAQFFMVPTGTRNMQLNFSTAFKAQCNISANRYVRTVLLRPRMEGRIVDSR